MALKLKTGMDAVQEAMDKRSGGSRDYIPNVIWKDDRNGKGEFFQHTLRFLPDVIVTCDVYDFIHCDDGTKRTFIVPESVGLEEPDWIAQNGVMAQNFAKEWVLASGELRTMTIAMAAFREEFSQKVDGRTEIGFRDVIEKREWEDKEGKKHTAEGPKFGIVKQAQKNFWNQFAPLNRRHKVHYGRDYTIERSGNDKGTTYSFIPEDQIEGLTTEAELLEHYKEAPCTIEEWLEARVATAEVCVPLLGKGYGRPTEDTKGEDKRSGELPSSEGEGEAQDGPVSMPKTSRMSGLRDDVKANM